MQISLMEIVRWSGMLFNFENEEKFNPHEAGLARATGMWFLAPGFHKEGVPEGVI
jgi:hypothetical protein